MDTIYITQKEAAKFVGVSVNTFKKICDVKPAFISANRKLYDRVALVEWAAAIRRMQRNTFR